MRRLILAVLMACAAAGTARAGEAGFAFLKIVPGARPSGMGTVATAMGGDLQTLELNPAGIAVEKDYGLTATHVELFEDMRLEHAAFGYRFKGGTLAWWVTLINEGTQQGRDINRQVTGDFGNSEYAGGAAYAFSLGEARLGVNLKALHSRIGEETGTGAAFDAGIMYPVAGFNLGASVLNAGKAPKLGGEGSDLPTSLGAGVSRRVLERILLAADLRGNIPEQKTSYGCGFEFELHKLIVLRGGYLHTNDNGERGNRVAKGLSGGFGSRVGSLTLDYAITSMGELGYVHRATLGLAF